MKKVLILGANGFIGNALVRRLAKLRSYEITGIDVSSHKLSECLGDTRFRFVEADVTREQQLVEREVARADVILPLVAIATPALYVKEPLRVFNLDFEENLRVIRYCVEHRKRIVFPSTSEVYGMSSDPEFDEDRTPLVLGPIRKQRWIYASLKQLLDRVIWAYGEEKGLKFTIFRPFNWIGPRLDSLKDARIGSSRVVTQFIGAILEGRPITLVDGGTQRRCFTYVSDGVDALERILENVGGVCDGQIFNIGNPDNECSMRELGERLQRTYRDLTGRSLVSEGFEHVNASDFYGKGYQDLTRRRPSIEKARTLLGWSPRVNLETAVGQTMAHFLAENSELRV